MGKKSVMAHDLAILLERLSKIAKLNYCKIPKGIK
jgi:hypothetical protein